MRQLFLYLLCTLFCVSAIAATPPPIDAIFQLDNKNSDKTFLASITLQNNSNFAINHWQLGFSFYRTITDIQEGSIEKQISYFYLISPNSKPNHIIPAHGQYVFHLKGKGAIKNITDAPAGYFLNVVNPLNHTDNIVTVNAKTVLSSQVKGVTAPPAASIAGNVDQTRIIPLPVSMDGQAGHFTLSKHTQIVVDSQAKTALTAAQFFTKSIAPATGYNLKPTISQAPQNIKNAIIFLPNATDRHLGQEGYFLQVTPENILIRANTTAGYFYAIQSLRQLLPPDVFNKKITSNIAWRIPCLTITDYPRFGYRGLLLDSARHFFSPAQVKRLIDLMAMHKLNRFQWHLTDDEGWRIEIKSYPALTSVGAWRGFNKKIPPVLSPNAIRYGGYYSQADIRDIIKYAAERHIKIIPEIDMPGHARAMLMSLPQLIDKSDLSAYTSAQGYHDNVLSPCMENTYTVINQIMTEVASLFPSDTIHVGSDEVPSGVWSKSPLCQKQMKALGLNNAMELQRYFLSRIKTIIQSNNKKMAVWNDAIRHTTPDTATTVYSWTDEKAGLQAATQGYSVILSPASYLYLDMAFNKDPIEPGLYWAGYVDTFRVYAYKPVAASWPSTVTANILGIQGALWSENVYTQKQLDYFLFPKLIALAEVAWTPEERRNWINFSQRVELHLKRLDHYGVLYRISPRGD